MARTYRVTMRCHHSGGTLIEPSVHYQTDVATGGNEPEPMDLLTKAWTTALQFIVPCLHNTIVVDELIAAEEVIKPNIGVGAQYVLGQNGTLAGADTSVSPGMVPVINLHTGTRSRSARGWLMLASPMSATYLGGKNWLGTGSFMTALKGFADQLKTGFDLGTIQPTHVNPVVYSPKRHGLGLTPYTFKVTSATVNPEARWLSSRLSQP